MSLLELFSYKHSALPSKPLKLSLTLSWRGGIYTEGWEAGGFTPGTFVSNTALA